MTINRLSSCYRLSIHPVGDDFFVFYLMDLYPYILVCMLLIPAVSSVNIRNGDAV